MKRILVVDDNTEYLEVLSTVLSSDFDTIKATGVKEALNILQAITVDAICSDQNMRDGTGLELLEKLRLEDVRIPFMLMTGSDDPKIINKAQSYGATFCCKTEYDLVDRISEMVNKLN
mgnify:CR=1 FL=1